MLISLHSDTLGVPEDARELISPRDLPVPPTENATGAEQPPYIEDVSDFELRGFGLPDPICLTGRRDALDQYMATVPPDRLIQFISSSDDMSIAPASDSATQGGAIMDVDNDARKYEVWTAAAYELLYPRQPVWRGPLDVHIGRLLPLQAYLQA